MSHPYGGAPEPGEQPPYQPYGSAPYGGSPYSPPGASATGHGTDGVSIAGFVLSLLCCTSVVGLILGIVGLSRTKDGVRSGRWAAVSAVVIGAIGTLVFAGSIVSFVWFGTSTVLIDNADVGQCVDIDEVGDGPDATIWDKDCDEPHDAEIVVADNLTSSEADVFDADEPDPVCADSLDEDYRSALDSGDYELGVVVESDDPDPGDPFVCYLQRTDGADLDESIAD
ncbi:DUF4190 domain-containing protein [Nocardioides antri]|uniref:DUF4190 domain-containing protein n=1 Tax=Nocardioides antri TaxID=2607659 RepID=A0A5B1M0M7_9ACTN|nr:DUF4190 domain-containing protein [Nocardioides antri]KAA1425659.1 DUF4190 domain-containing protein [Nocardioides antri]